MVTPPEDAVDIGTIPTALLAIGGFALFLVMLRRLPPAEDDVAVVVAAIVRTPVELEVPCGARPEETHASPRRPQRNGWR
jgi:hypothetical protein